MRYTTTAIKQSHIFRQSKQICLGCRNERYRISGCWQKICNGQISSALKSWRKNRRHFISAHANRHKSTVNGKIVKRSTCLSAVISNSTKHELTESENECSCPKRKVMSISMSTNLLSVSRCSGYLYLHCWIRRTECKRGINAAILI